MIIGEWRSDAPVSIDPPGLDPRLDGEIARFDAQLCESCRVRCLEPLCPSCFEMSLRELEALVEGRWSAGEDL